MENYQREVCYSFELGAILFTVLRFSSVPFSRMIPPHQHSLNGYEIHYIVEGQGSLFLPGKTESIKPYDLLVTGPGIMHEIIPGEQGLREFCFYVQIQPSKKASLTDQDHQIAALWTKHRYWKSWEEEPYKTILKQLDDELKEPRWGQHQAVTILFQQWILAMLRGYAQDWQQSESRNSVPDDYRKINIENAFLFDSENLTLPALADRLQLSVRQTERILKDEFQATFTELKQKATINRAVTLLRTTRKTITEIAEETNFCSASYFCKMLKQQTGKTATQIRREQTLENAEKK